MSIYVLIPGEPCAQGRPRMAVVNGHARAYDPAKSRSWKGAARVAMTATRQSPIMEGPIAVEIRAVHSCPRTDYRQREPQPARWRDRKPDIENIVKAVLDAATGVLWRDDAQIARLTVEQITGAQGESPCVEMWARELPELYSGLLRSGPGGEDYTVGDAAELVAGPGAELSIEEGAEVSE